MTTLIPVNQLSMEFTGVHGVPPVAQKKDAKGCHGTDQQLHNSLITVIYNIKQNRFILFKEINVEFKLLMLFSICMVLFFKKK